MPSWGPRTTVQPVAAALSVKCPTSKPATLVRAGWEDKRAYCGWGVALVPPAFSVHFLHLVMPRIVQIKQMNVPQSSHG